MMICHSTWLLKLFNGYGLFCYWVPCHKIPIFRTVPKLRLNKILHDTSLLWTSIKSAMRVSGLSLNYKPLTYNVAILPNRPLAFWCSGLSNCIVYRRFEVQNLLWPLEFMIYNKSRVRHGRRTKKTKNQHLKDMKVPLKYKYRNCRVHETISLVWKNMLNEATFRDGRSISQNVASLNILVHDLISLLYYEH